MTLNQHELYGLRDKHGDKRALNVYQKRVKWKAERETNITLQKYSSRTGETYIRCSGVLVLQLKDVFSLPRHPPMVPCHSSNETEKKLHTAVAHSHNPSQAPHSPGPNSIAQSYPVD